MSICVCDKMVLNILAQVAIQNLNGVTGEQFPIGNRVNMKILETIPML